ncbi:hypothetical protein O3M35_011016 [Rhynocoris fuscipes]|uniref:Uncharacterized protein n=1 Tax=Rhynocoris fuscipes TaxID=488301 RepID=A0AAW1CV13_9HEMI
MSKLLEKARAEHEQRKAVNESKQKLMERQLRLFQLVEDRRKQAEELAKHREETEGKFYLSMCCLLN